MYKNGVPACKALIGPPTGGEMLSPRSDLLDLLNKKLPAGLFRMSRDRNSVSVATFTPGINIIL